MHILKVPSFFFFTNKAGRPHSDLLGRINPFSTTPLVVSSAQLTHPEASDKVSSKLELSQELTKFQTQHPYRAEDQVTHLGTHPETHTLPESDE
jgi:hypothetical protein